MLHYPTPSFYRGIFGCLSSLIPCGIYIATDPGLLFHRTYNTIPCFSVHRKAFCSAACRVLSNRLPTFDYFYNRSLYGGSIRALIKIEEDGRHIYITNYGALVAGKGEGSLTRLARSLTRGAHSAEEQAQLLLDFVTEEIEYDYNEGIDGNNIIKRPNEVLMTGISACGGKSVLYASLLEQLDIDYKFLYYEDHISVGVAGDYGNHNHMTLLIYHLPYSIAETTAINYQIGKSILNRPLGIEMIEFIQRPGKGANIYDVKSGDPLPFG